MLSTQGSKLSLKLIIAGWTILSRAIMMAQVRSLEMAEIKNGGHTRLKLCTSLVLPFGPIHGEMVSKPCISVEATSKGLIPDRSLESCNAAAYRDF